MLVFCSSESNTRFGTPLLKAIARYASCRMRILRRYIFSFPSAICGFLGSTPVVSTNGVNKLCPATGSPNSWISCCRGKRRSWWQGCCDQPLRVRVQEHSANTELSDFSGAKVRLSPFGPTRTEGSAHAIGAHWAPADLPAEQDTGAVAAE